MGAGWPGWVCGFGFTGAFRTPEDDEKHPNQPLPVSEAIMARFSKHFCLVGNTDDVRREMDLLVEAVITQVGKTSSRRLGRRLRSAACK